MSGPIIHHAHRPIGNADVLGVIINICKEEKAYRTILLVALMSKHHHAIVQPVLTRIKNRVVLDLDDFAWRNKENDGNIEIIICNRNSTRPTELGSRHVDPHLETRLHPAIILFRGRPEAEAFGLWHVTFPSTPIIVFSEDSRLQLVDPQQNLEASATDTMNAVHRFYKLYDDAISKEKLPDRDITIKYRFHTAYQQLRLDRAGQRLYQLGSKIPSTPYGLDLDVLLCDPPFDQDDIVKECMATIPLDWVCLREMTLTGYIQLPGNSAGTLFLREEDAEGTIPAVYERLSEMIDRLTPKIIEGKDSRFIFRLFILHHGEQTMDRDEMTPIYSSTTRLAPDNPKRSVVIRRDYDEDFAGCIVNGGCRRCRG